MSTGIQCGGPLPQVKVTAATPSKPSCSSQLPIGRDTTARLLYRGSLSLPDTHLLLDGLTFSINLPTDDQQASMRLLETPLPLALESMRGRPSLGFVGVERIDALHARKLDCEFDGGVDLHVHPRCTLTRQLFMHNLCASPINPETGRSTFCIRIRLGDDDGIKRNASNDIAVFGQTHPSSSTMQLRVARIIPLAPSPALPKAVSKLRPPRPDDPTPRKPPPGFSLARIGLGNASKRQASSSTSADARPPKKSKKDQELEKNVAEANNSLMELGENSRMSVKPLQSNESGTFKVPNLPLPKRSSEKMKEKGKAKERPFDAESDPKGETESRNKNFVKTRTVDLLTSAGITKNDPEFKDFFSVVYKGTAFALRVKMRTVLLEEDIREAMIIERLVQAHLTMYLSGRGIDIPTGH